MITLLLIPLVTGIVCFFIPKPKLIGYISFLGSLVLAGFTAVTISNVFSVQAVKEGIFYVDALSGYIMAIVVFLSCLATAYSIEYLAHELDAGLTDLKYIQRFYLLLNAFISSMLFVVMTDNLAIMWIAIEATTIISAPLIGLGFSKRDLAIEAAWKYIIL